MPGAEGPGNRPRRFFFGLPRPSPPVERPACHCNRLWKRAMGASEGRLGGASGPGEARQPREAGTLPREGAPTAARLRRQAGPTRLDRRRSFA